MGELFRIGTVTDIRTAERLVRVRFPDVDIVSGWLKVVKSPPRVTIKWNVGVETEPVQEPEFEILPWFPNIGDVVICAYNLGFNDDGYVLGGI